MKNFFLISLILTSLFSKEIKNENDVINMVKESQKILPKSINKEITLIEIDYNNKDKAIENIINFETLNEKELEIAKMKEIIKEALKINICNKKTTKELFKLHIKLRFLYYDVNGVYFYGKELTPEFCSLVE